MITTGEWYDPDFNNHIPKVKLSRALSSMVYRVNSPEARLLARLTYNPHTEFETYVNATFDFLQTLPAFHSVKDTLEFMDKHLIESDSWDDTRPEDIPDHYINL